jgi:hypothetical protein
VISKWLLAKLEWKAVCGESVRRETGESNPCRRQEKLEGGLLGHPPYPMVKA